MLIVKQAKVYQNEMKTQGHDEFSAGWIQKFRKRHDIGSLKSCAIKYLLVVKSDKETHQ